MKKDKKRKNRKLVIVAIILLLLISIGYAALSSNLQILGKVTVAKTTWDVHFDNVQVEPGSATATKDATISGTTKVEYVVNLNNVSDYYEFTVDVKNAGTVDAVIGTGGIVKTELSEHDDTYVNYTVTYDDGTAIAVGDELASGATRTLKVRVEYDSSLTPDVLNTLTNDISLTLEYSLNYVQK